MHLAMGPVDLGARAEGALAVLSERAERQGLDLDLDAPEPLVVLGDGPALDRVLTNLVSNAINFTEEGSVRVTIQREGARALLRIIDTGIGINTEFLPTLFAEFRQGSEGGTRGTGSVSRSRGNSWN